MTKQNPKQDPQDHAEPGTWNREVDRQTRRIISRIGKTERPAYRGGREYAMLPEERV
ncbi:hypothetical protein [Methylobacterium sp. Leaf399]|uniref:hypothetical protein n=1 Tax=Methylobacterium sp. Leaf399 TaxID=1736364 RepID=UPI000A830770|nr:hypothetical protein [Methylobacterium sp. Leaf399]